jgi:hypothetical protein
MEFHHSVIRLMRLFVTVCAFLSCFGAAEATPRVERVVLDVEVRTFDRKPVIACGGVGAQPRDATADLLEVVEGSFTAKTVQLAWPVCEWDHIEIGSHYRIRLARFATQTGKDAEVRFEVHDPKPQKTSPKR